MTPTEQDKELEKAVWASLASQMTHAINCTDPEHKRQDSCVDFTEKNFEQLMQLITADRKRVELGARIDELEKFVNTTNRSLSVKKLRDRLSELKAQHSKLNRRTNKMMPYCEHHKCNKVAALKLGSKIGTGGDYYDDFKWEQVVYLCPNHYIEVMVLLGRDKKRVEKDIAEYNRRMAEHNARQAKNK